MTRRALLTLVSLMVAQAATSAPREPARALQAKVMERGWTFQVQGRRARVIAPDGARRSFRVRSDERWLAFSELPQGWLATGIRPDRRGQALALVADLGRGPRRLTPPADRAGSLRTRPVALAGEKGLGGIAWLEGDSFGQLSVRVAELNGLGFQKSETVAVPHRGSQSGLAGRILDDGSWLLVWSRHDGRDDEIVWSRRFPDGAWSAPRRVAKNNSVPDVMPDLLPVAGGALAAWSRLEGEYQVVLSRFENGAWSPPRRVGGRGGLFPTFRRVASGDYLLVRNAYPGGWTAFDLRPDGRPTRFASVVEESREAPVLNETGRSGPAFVWPHRQGEVALDWEAVP